MKTVGELIKAKRLEKNLDLEDIEKRTKIRKKFLQAIEEDNFKALPSLAVAKGFVKNYANYLRLDTDRMMAIFRRQLHVARQNVLPDSVSEPIQPSFWQLTPNKAIGAVLTILILILAGYFFQQYRNFQKPPQLTVEQPKSGTIVTKKSVAVFGKTDIDATIQINDMHVSVDEEGKFFVEVPLLEQNNTIVVVAKNRNGKQTIVEREVVVEEEE